MQLRRYYSIVASSIIQTALVHACFGNCAGAASLFYLSTTLCHFSPLLRRWRSFDWDTSIRWASRQEETTESSRVKKKNDDTIIVQFCGCWLCRTYINLLAPNLFFLILAHLVYKMWIIQEPYKLELWNKLHFEEKKKGQYTQCLKFSVHIFVA